MSSYIVDASVAIKWVVTEADTTTALKLLDHRLYAPALFRAECANILWKKVRRSQLTPQAASVAAHVLNQSGIKSVPVEPDLYTVFELSITLDHPAYDCVYLAAAMAQNLPLVTADASLAAKVSQSASLKGKVTVLQLDTF